MIRIIQKLYTISRPRFRMYSFGPMLIGLVAGYMHIGTLPHTTTLIYIGLVALWTLTCSNIIIYGANDLADEDTDALNTKKDDYEARLQQDDRSMITNALYICICLGVLILLGGRQFVYVGQAIYRLIIAYVIFLFTGIGYSVDPLRAKKRPFLDGISNVLYIIPSIWGWMIMTGSIDGFGRWGFVAGWLWAMSMHAYSAIPDIAPDQQAGLHTTAVMLGYRGTLLYCLGLRCLAAAIAAWQFGSIYICLLLPYIVMIYLSRRGQIMKWYRYFPRINAVVGFCLFWMIVLL